ncbi:MAG: orotidine-5'-phosphate decarboxylase [Melioribacteraceae bacterium]|nr:orotidine-5'-phosphate decarboxylase [Melioribacteraceae bacterium]
MNSKEKLATAFKKNYHICIGLDTDINKIPEFLKSEKSPISVFNKMIIESTYECAAAYKINFAFYEQEGAKGYELLEETRKCIPENIFTIADAKRGDIGNTSEMYAKAVFDLLNFDSITLHPYMGNDSLSPFLNYVDRLCFILALTSNKGAIDFEKLELANGNLLYQEVIEKVKLWNTNKNLGLVFGATKLEELKENISRFEDLPILLPGVGAQGGSLEDVVSTFNNSGNNRFLINISRGLIYVDSSREFINKVKMQLSDFNKSIEKINN